MRLPWASLPYDAPNWPRMAPRSEVEPVWLPVSGVGAAGRPTAGNLVPFRTIAEPDFSGVADAVWVGETDDDCPLCFGPCISDGEEAP